MGGLGLELPVEAAFLLIRPGQWTNQRKSPGGSTRFKDPWTHRPAALVTAVVVAFLVERRAGAATSI